MPPLKLLPKVIQKRAPNGNSMVMDRNRAFPNAYNCIGALPLSLLLSLSLFLSLTLPLSLSLPDDKNDKNDKDDESDMTSRPGSNSHGKTQTAAFGRAMGSSGIVFDRRILGLRI